MFSFVKFGDFSGNARLFFSGRRPRVFSRRQHELERAVDKKGQTHADGGTSAFDPMTMDELPNTASNHEYSIETCAFGVLESG